ncbi:GNAT family N-acetyltransferase [Wohlfahrtiimonas larvae]|uniref:N-acetyltransferase domain-containing protein n=1 Tax=Wohlfahrtiimonas larvae TaxID=1157986 RepID=A0ABP9MZI9_9GAMM|nr:GNAT family N-acetyltransferase [Wohlfahrtiimonas larvae]
MRKLFLLSETNTEIINQALIQIHHQCADLVVLSPDSTLFLAKPLHHAKGLLGHTLNCVVLDCRLGFPLDYFLCAANTIQTDGTFILIWQQNNHDEQSSRFHTETIPTPNFQNYLAKGLQKFSELWDIAQYIAPTVIQNQHNHLNHEQITVLSSLQKQQKGITTLFAPRGTGKSFVVAEFIRSLNNDCVITAPNQTALQSYHNIKLNFKAPDYLFLNHNDFLPQKWLIIEEAAQMPIVHLEKLSKLAENILLVSSIENYEGTGKGLERKLQDIITIDLALTLNKRQRFELQDPLAQFCEYISFQNYVEINIQDGIYLYSHKNLHKFQSNYALVQAFYQFMNQHHYQTNAQDIRRLLDSPNQIFIIHIHNQQIIGGLWAILEGELSEDLAQEVFRGYRRPKGNLVVQTLAAHSYYPELMILKSLRISRIAVDHNHRTQGIAKHMLEELKKYAQDHHYDFLSTSFGLTEPLLKFWEQCGFTWIHLGSHRDKTTGLHAAILLQPISKAMMKKMSMIQKKWQNDAFQLVNAPFVHTTIHYLLEKQSIKGNFDHLDETILHANLYHKKPVEAVFSALERQKRIDD